MNRADHDVIGEVELEIFVTDENQIFVKFSGFESSEDASSYAEYLNENLGLLLFESKVLH